MTEPTQNTSLSESEDAKAFRYLMEKAEKLAFEEMEFRMLLAKAIEEAIKKWVEDSSK